MSDDRDVLAANQAFYDAFAERDLAALDAVWAKRPDVSCAHPGWDVIHGRDPVMASWRSILDAGGPPHIRCARALAHVFGDVAFVTCVEFVSGGTLLATNVFVREPGRWLMIHHHAGPIGRIQGPEEVELSPPTPSLN